MSRTLHDVASGTLFGVALNYQGLLDQHLAAFQQPPYQQPPTKPVLFIKTPNTRNAHGGVVLQPAGERLQPGPALGVVIGQRASRVSLENAMAHVAGYVVVNEFSLPEDSYYRPAVKAKCRDGFCAIGPERKRGHPARHFGQHAHSAPARSPCQRQERWEPAWRQKQPQRHDVHCKIHLEAGLSQIIAPAIRTFCARALPQKIAPASRQGGTPARA